MNPLQRALIEKAGNDHGFEYVLPAHDDRVQLASARHRAQAGIVIRDGRFVLAFSSAASGLLNDELARSFPAAPRAGEDFVALDEEALAQLLRRAAERLDVFNGFLLSAHLDALFDRFLVSFNDEGRLLLSPRITADIQARLGLNPSMHLRWLAAEHQPYLDYHRERFGAIT
jgi:hypothetical protein